jgi:hypothetical protein
MKKRVLYLHGLESSNIGDKIDFLSKKAIVLSPPIDYHKSNIEDELMSMIESFQPNLIIGSSMGGYMGILLANYYNIDCLVFNPAIHSRSIEPCVNILGRNISKDFIPVIVLGMDDSVVDPIKTVNILKHLDFYCDIEKMNGLGHRIPLNVFIDIYDKYIK